MQATAELQLIPLGARISVRDEVRRAVELLRGHDLVLETHTSGTNIQGDLHAILTEVQEVHETLHAEGTVKLVSYLKLETRTDKATTLAGKKL